jgi:preprotein translocase subunit SecA
LINEIGQIFPLPPEMRRKEDLLSLGRDAVTEAMLKAVEDAYELQEKTIVADAMRRVESLVMLRTIDLHWVQHLTAMENLRQGIGLHAFGQRDPLTMYKSEGHRMFQGLLSRIENDIVRTIFHVQLRPVQPAPQAAEKAENPDFRDEEVQESPMAKVGGGRRRAAATLDPKFRKVGRNDPCPCGSGKKYKKCHGANQ